jgi:hypothetical protein
MRIERDCFELGEIAEGWGLTDADIRYLVGNGTLTLSVRLVAQPAVLSVAEEVDKDLWEWIPLEQRAFHGVADLMLRDGFGLVRDGQRTITDVLLGDRQRLTLRNGGGLRVKRKDALVRRAHWEEIRADVLLKGPHGDGEAFDFRQFVYEEQNFAFTFQQARALAFMLEMTRAGAPDQHYLAILQAAGSASQRLGSLFSRKPCWTRLLHKTPGRRGWYYLDPGFVVWLTRGG